MRTYSTKPNNKWSINPLENAGKTASNKLCAMDVETKNLYDGVRIPMAITFAYKLRNKIYCFLTLIDFNLLI